MLLTTYRAAFAAITATTLAVLGAGCGHPASSDALTQQKASVMGSPAPPEVQAQVAVQMQKQQAAQQAAQQAGMQAAQQQGQTPK